MRLPPRDAIINVLEFVLMLLERAYEQCQQDQPGQAAGNIEQASYELKQAILEILRWKQ